MNSARAKQQILAQATTLGFDACRITHAAAPASGPRYTQWLASRRHGQMTYMERNHEKRLDPSRILPQLNSIITLATSYHQHNHRPQTTAKPPPQTTPGLIARYARYTDYHNILAAKLKTLANTINQTTAPASHSLWYTDTGPILERDLAQRAGIGFIGKHTNLISRSLGNWFFLSEILTTAKLPPDPPEKNRCGTCTRCLDACPTQAIPKPFVLDARRCIAYLTIELKGPIPIELRPAIGNRIFGCDDCLDACPWNRFAHEGRIMQSHAKTELANIPLRDWAQLDETTFKQRFRHTPLYRTKWRGLLRNICVALGNTGHPSHLPALQRLSKHRDSLVAEHATWALNQIQNRQKQTSPAPAAPPKKTATDDLSLPNRATS